MDYFTLFEWIAAILGALGVFLAAKVNTWNWFISLFSVLIYTFLFYKVKFYADSGLQVIYLFLTCYGWWKWKNNNQNDEFAISYIKAYNYIIYFFISIILFVIIFNILKYFNSAMQLLDAITATLSLIATYLLAKKKIENWLIWIVADVTYCYMYYSKQLWITLALYLFFTAIAVWAFFTWKKIIDGQKIV